MTIENRYKNAGKPLMGGMAAVYPCRDTILERNVAIKILPNGQEQRRIHDELKALLKMRSKHVVQIYDLFFIENDLAIVQEFIDGEDLFDIPKPDAVIDYLKLIWQIAAGLSDIHENKVIHRDIKPNNMKVDGEGILKIFDFGLARDEGPEASTIGFVGTPGFAAPELYTYTSKFTSAVDTYAFGMTALFLGLGLIPPELSKKPPILNSSDKYFDSIPYQLPSETLDALKKCLDPIPENRPSMSYIKNIIEKSLLKDQHKALVVYNGKASYLDKSRRLVTLNLPNVGGIDILYDGYDFIVKNIHGDVYVNNMSVSVGYKLPGACVVTLGAPELQNLRKYITFDLSHPEIVL